MPDLTWLNQIAAFTAICVAAYGIDSWRREHTGKRRIELCEDALTLFYEAKEVIQWVRSPMSSSDETAEVERQDQETEEAFNARKQAFIVFKRFRDHKDLFSKIHAMRYRFMAQLGKEKAKPFDDLWGVQNDIKLAARMLSHLWAHRYHRTDAQYEATRKQIVEHECVFWQGVAEAHNRPDVVAEKLDKAVADLEFTCNAVIAGAGTMGGFLNRRL